MAKQTTNRNAELIDIAAGDIEVDLGANARQEFTTVVTDATTGKERHQLNDRGFVADVRERWVMQPPRVREVAKGRYSVVFGYRRVLAAQEVDPSRVLTCSVQPEKGAAGVVPALVANYVENEQRSDFRPWEKAEAIYRLKRESGMSTGEVAERLGMSKSHAANLYNLRARACEFVWKLYKRHGEALNWHAVAEVVKKPKAEQEQAWNELVTKGKRKPGPKKKASKSEMDAELKRVRAAVASVAKELTEPWLIPGKGGKGGKVRAMTPAQLRKLVSGAYARGIEDGEGGNK